MSNEGVLSGETAVQVDETGFDVLERKIVRAVELIHSLRSERVRLLEKQTELEARLAVAGSVAPEAVEELSGRVMRLEAERAQWLAEKRDMTRRIEAILAKLEFLESESVPR